MREVGDPTTRRSFGSVGLVRFCRQLPKALAARGSEGPGDEQKGEIT